MSLIKTGLLISMLSGLTFTSMVTPTYSFQTKEDFCATALKRFQQPSQLFRAVISHTSNHFQLIDEIMTSDMRGQVFRLEGLARIYRRIHGKPFGKMRALTKELEDAIGKYDEREQFLQMAEHWNRQERLIPERALNVLRKDKSKAHRKLAELLSSTWAPHTARDKGHAYHTAFEKMNHWLKDVNFKSEKFDRRRVIRTLMRELTKVENANYDMSQLQDGVHEFRRALRWFLIYFQGFDGLFELVDTPVPTMEVPNAYRPLETHPMAQARFSTLPVNPKVQTVKIPRAIFLALSKAVVELGEIKSKAENIEALGEALRRARLNKREEAHARAHSIAARNKMDIDFEKQATVVQVELKRTLLLRSLRDYLEKQLED